MIRKAMKILCNLFSVCCILLIAGCDSEQESWDIDKLNKQVGISFPSDTIVLSATDGGGKERDVGYNAYTWTLFSPIAVEMPSIMKHHGYPSLEDTVKYIESSMYKKKIKILKPQYAFDSDWEMDNYRFHATVVRSLQGDYIVIDRIRKK